MMHVEALDFSGGHDCRITVPADGAGTFRLTVSGIDRLEFGRVVCGNFSEDSALFDKLRLHSSNDGLEKTWESRSVIPFGCEYQIGRSGEFVSGLGRLTTDVRALGGGRIGDLELEELRFAAPWRKAEFLVNGENAFRTASPGNETLYLGAEPLLMLRVTFPDGVETEFAVGNDLWRQRAGAHTPGAHGEFSLVSSSDGLHYRRRVLIRDPEIEPEKRPWRFSALFGWKNANNPPVEAENRFRLQECMLGSVNRRTLRKQLRTASGSVTLDGIAPRVCLDAAHLERPGRGEIEHFDLEEHLVSYIWGNRQLHRRNGSFTMIPEPGKIFSDSVIVGNLGNVPEVLNQNQGVDDELQTL